MITPLYIPIANWVAAFVFVTFATAMMLGTKRPSTRAYAFVAYCAAGWVLGLGMYFFSTTSRWLVFWNEWNHLLAGLIAVGFYYFTVLIPRESHPRRGTIAFLAGLELLFLYAYFFTDLIITDSSFLARNDLERYGDLFFSVGPIFYTHFFVFLMAGFWNLYRTIKSEKDSETRRQLSYILWGTAIGVIPPTLTDIVLPYLGFYDLYWAAGILTLGWIIFISYSIARHHIFNVRLVITAIASTAIATIAGLLFVDIFLPGEFEFGILGRAIIFGVFGGVGSFLIAGIVRAERQREALKRLSGELEKTNSSLKRRVASRTARLKREGRESAEIIEELADALVEYDAAFTVVRMNRAAEELFGLDRNSIIGKQIRPELVHDRELQSLVIATYPILSPGKSAVRADEDATAEVAMINEVITSYPYERELEVATMIIRAADAPDRCIKVIRDITKEKQVSRSKSEFITIAGHRLRTPLSVIKWTFSLMLEEGADALMPKQRSAIERANMTNERMIRLVNDLLNTAHIEEGQFGYEIKEDDISSLITEIMPEFETLAKEKNVTLSLSIPEESMMLYFDREKMSLALRNLIENAVNYTNPGGRVTIVAIFEPDDAVITVSDTGIGIAENEQARLFTKFFRGTNAKRSRSEGTGLGLFIIKNIIARHGGTITVQSVLHGGTTFTMRLPRKPERIPEYGS